MMTIQVSGEHGQVEIWADGMAIFSEWEGDEGQPFSRTDTAISIKTYGPVDDSEITLNILSNKEIDKLDPKKVKMFSGSIAIPSGKINIGDTIIKSYLQFKFEHSIISLIIYVDIPGDANQVDFVIEGDISSGVEFGV